MSCEVCGREAEGRFCEFHKRAYENMVSTYEAWRRAKETSWTEYLKETLKNQFSGLWCKEVASKLLEDRQR